MTWAICDDAGEVIGYFTGPEAEAHMQGACAVPISAPLVGPHRHLGDGLFEALPVVARVPSWDRQRRAAYLSAWSLEQQAEALADLASGNTEKHQRMTADFAAIRTAIPKPEEIT